MTETPPASPRPATGPGAPTITVLGDDTRAVVRVAGEVDIASVDRLRAAADQTIAVGAATVVVDLSTCTFLDSSGLQVLLALRERLNHADRTLQVRPGLRQVQRVFEISGLHDRFFPPA